MTQTILTVFLRHGVFLICIVNLCCYQGSVTAEADSVAEVEVVSVDVPVNHRPQLITDSPSSSRLCLPVAVTAPSITSTLPNLTVTLPDVTVTVPNISAVLNAGLTNGAHTVNQRQLITDSPSTNSMLYLPVTIAAVPIAFTNSTHLSLTHAVPNVTVTLRNLSPTVPNVSSTAPIVCSTVPNSTYIRLPKTLPNDSLTLPTATFTAPNVSTAIPNAILTVANGTATQPNVFRAVASSTHLRLTDKVLQTNVTWSVVPQPIFCAVESLRTAQESVTASSSTTSEMAASTTVFGIILSR